MGKESQVRFCEEKRSQEKKELLNMIQKHVLRREKTIHRASFHELYSPKLKPCSNLYFKMS